MISGIQTTNSTLSNSQTTTSKDEVMGKDDFLNLLVTQLKNQDPLNPMDSAGFTAQLAQFSSLEQLTNVNSKLETMISSQSDMTNNQAISYIGKNVFSYGNQINLSEGVSDRINFELNGNAKNVSIQIYDSSNKLIRTIEGNDMKSGENSCEWDGLNSNGQPVSDGTYTFNVYAYDANGKGINTIMFTENKITGITYNNNGFYLNSGNISIGEKNIFKVSGN
jgi:flagellar basal-body rod modification protein FlgD